MRTQVVVVVVLLLELCGCEPAPVSGAGATAGPAKVIAADGLNRIVLTAAAETRLGIATAAIEEREIVPSRALGGEVVIPPGLAISVAAPLAGRIALPPGAGPTAGAHVERGQPVFSLTPILDPAARAGIASSLVVAAGDAETAAVEVAAAEVELRRTETLLAADTGSQREVDDARARLAIAAATRAAAERRRALLESLASGDTATPTSIVVESPLAGLVRRVDAAAGQVVPAGAPLFEVVQLEPQWIRVPVHVGEVAAIDTASPVSVAGFGQAPGAPARRANPVAAPPAADPGAATVDLVYELEEGESEFRPGQRVRVVLNLRSAATTRVVPWSAVVYDPHGGAWVYERTEAHTFVRRRVEVGRVEGGSAFLARGPTAGTAVVTAGVAELYGTEFPGGK